MFKAELEHDELVVEPGGTAKVGVVVTNTSDQPGRYALEVEGLDLEWCAIPVPSFVLQPGDETRERILIKPPRSSESRAGVYPFVIVVRSLEDDEKVSRQGSVRVERFNLLTLELNPKRSVVTPTSRTAHFLATVANLGNTEQYLQLFASDPEDGCTYEFGQERVTLPPGSHVEVPLDVQPTRRPIISSPRLYGFSMSARSVEDSHVSAVTQGQVERRALFGVSTLVSMMVVAALILAGWYLWPRAAEIRQFQVDQVTVTQGGAVNVRWRVAHADSVHLQYRGQVIRDGLPPVGSFRFTPAESGGLVLIAEGRMGSVQSREKQVTVLKPEEAPLPEIVALSVKPEQIRKGETVTIHYVVRFAEKIYIAPLGVELETVLTDKDVPIPRSGTYTLVAVNADKKTVRRDFKVTVEESDVDIFFEATPGSVDVPGQTVTLRWDLRRAVRAQINADPATTTIGPISPMSGTMTVPIFETTTFILEATDSNDRTAVQKVVVPLVEAGDGGEGGGR